MGFCCQCPSSLGFCCSVVCKATILVMLAESMIPEAYEEGGVKIGIATMVGFAVAFILGKMEGG